MPETKAVSTLDNVVVKSPNDRRLYRVIELENGLSALLIHDPDIYPEGYAADQIDEDDEDGEEEEDSDGSYEDDEEDDDEVEGKGDQQTKKVFRSKIHHLLYYSFTNLILNSFVLCCDVSGSCSYVCCNG